MGFIKLARQEETIYIKPSEVQAIRSSSRLRTQIYLVGGGEIETNYEADEIIALLENPPQG